MKPEQQTEYIVQCLRDSGSMYEDDARKFLAEHDAYVRATALADAKVEVVAWLVKKAAEGTPIGELASKVDRGAVRVFLGTGHYRDAMDAHRDKVTVEVLRGAAESAAEIHSHCHRTACAGCEVRRDILDVLTSVADVIGEKATPVGATATPDQHATPAVTTAGDA